MLKLIMFSFSLKLFKSTSLILLMLSLSLLLILSKFTIMETTILDKMLFQDNLSMLLIMLTLISTILILLSSNDISKIMKMITYIMIILLLAFSSMNMISFYILFELVLIPTMMLIMMNGKQPERLQASIYLMIYTITASLPLLINIILTLKNQSFLIPVTLMTKSYITLPFIMAFLVKSPMFMTHLWLPKAHVEAPLEGSMILAAILLKLGGYGLIRFLPLCISKMNMMNPWIISISMIGATITGMNCIRQKDLKSLIAYSSVSHMALVLVGLFTYNYLGLLGALMMMIAHGFSSSALFLLVNDIYNKYHSRNILSFKGLLLISPNIVFWWFMFMAINVSAPPTINTFSEILIMMSSILWNNSTMIMIFLISISVMSFSMMMFINIYHNKNEMNPSFQTSHKIMLSLFMHMIPLILLITKMELNLI